MRGQLDEQLVRSDGAVLNFFFAVHELFHLLVEAERRAEVAFDVDSPVVQVLGDGTTRYQHGESEVAVAWHYRLFWRRCM